MPLTKRQKNLKIVCTGNFHEETENLPDFLSNYSNRKQVKFYEQFGENKNGDDDIFINNCSSRIYGKNTIRYNEVTKKLYYFFCSTDHVLFKFDKKSKNFRFFKHYKNTDVKRGIVKEILTIGSVFEFDFYNKFKDKTSLDELLLRSLMSEKEKDTFIKKIIECPKEIEEKSGLRKEYLLKIKNNDFKDYSKKELNSKADVLKITINNIEKELKQLFTDHILIEDWLYQQDIDGVFTSCLSSCGFQTVMIEKDDIKYLLFSHLQRKSPVICILKQLEMDISNISACINHCLPDTSSLDDCFYGFEHEIETNKKCITLLRNSFFWKHNLGPNAYGLIYAGYLLAGSTLQAQYQIGLGPLFSNANNSYLQIKNRPLFNTFNKQKKDIILKDKDKEADAIYYTLFLEGKLGDNYFIKNCWKPDENNAFTEDFFIKNYSFENSFNLSKNSVISDFYKKTQPKFISWEKPWEFDKLAICINEFKPEPKPELFFVDFSVGTIEEILKKSIEKYELIKKSKLKDESMERIKAIESDDEIIELADTLEEE